MQKSLKNLSSDDRFLVILVTFALALRLFRIGAQSLWVDEILTVIVSNPVKEGLNIWSYLKYNIHGPLHSLSVYLVHFISMSDGWLRLPSALAGAGAVAYFYVWVRGWLGRNVARIGAVMLTVHPLHMFYSQETRNYSFLIMFALMACYYFHRLVDNGRRRDWIWYVAAVALAALSNFTAAFLFAAHSLIYFARKGVRLRTLSRWTAVSVVILLLISPWVYRVYTFIDVSKLVTPVKPGQLTTVERLRGETTVSATALPYAFYTLSVGFSLGPSTRELHVDHSIANVVRRHAPAVVWVGLLFGGLLVAGVRGAVRRRLPWAELLLYFFLPVVGTLLLNWQNAKAFNIRYVLLSLPAYLCFIAIGLDILRPWMRAAGLGLVALTLLVSTGNYYFNGRYAREDVKGAVRYLEERLATDECVFAPAVRDVVDHYLRARAPLYSVYNRPWVKVEQVDAQLERLFAACNSFWYVRARWWVDDPDGYVWREITSRYEQSQSIEFNGVTLIKLDRKKGP